MIAYYSGSTIAALLHLFPEIGLDRSKFPMMPSVSRFYFSSCCCVNINIIFFSPSQSLGNHWADIDNRRKFFDKVAEEKGFDPLVAEHWYEIVPQMLNSKVFTVLQSIYTLCSFSLFVFFVHLLCWRLFIFSYYL